jgi:hypothetical protein
MDKAINLEEQKLVEKYFGVRLEKLSPDKFKQERKKLMSKYHPDKFQHFEDETISEMATERFQQIQSLSEKIEHYFNGKITLSLDDKIRQTDAIFAFDKLRIEIVTNDKELKYDMFGTYYRWLTFGESFNIPNTGAFLVMQEEHRGHQIGFVETIKIFLTFGVKDAVEDIVSWFFQTIDGRAKSLIIAGKKIPVEYDAMLMAIRRKAFLELGA